MTWARCVEILRAGARRQLTDAMPVDSSDFDRLDYVTPAAKDDIPALTWGELRRLLAKDRRTEATASPKEPPHDA